MSQNNPNPFDGITYVNLNVAEQGDVAVEITDIAGRIVGANNDSPLPQPKNAYRGATDHPFDLGDQMEYVGFVNVNSTEQGSSHIKQAQNTSQTIVLSFALPCSGTPTVTDHDGNTYNTVQIGQQCWMRENLRTTHYAGGWGNGFYNAGTDAYFWSSTRISGDGDGAWGRTLRNSSNHVYDVGYYRLSGFSVRCLRN